MKILAPDAQKDRDDFNQKYADDGCRCFLSAPCNHCTHPGNPANQDEDPMAWQEIGYDMM